MFTVYHSNQLDLLKSLLVELISLNPVENPFEKEQILVQSPGMSQWLKMELAKSFGVAANIEFPLPATFIWTMFTKVLDDVPERSAFNKEAMTWKLMDVLPLQLELAEFAPLKSYLSEDVDGQKLYQLSEKIADIFDQYLVYRPQWIKTWEAGESVAELLPEIIDGEQGEMQHAWQPLLWQALYDQTLALDQSPYHRANLYEHFIETLDAYSQHGGELPEGLPKRLFVFGISSLPPRYMDALAALGQHIDVHLMCTNPCRYYWGDIRDRKYLARLAAKQRSNIKWIDDHSEHGEEREQLKGTIEQNELDEQHLDAVGNSLLASMGKLGRDNFYLISEMEAQEVEAFVEIERDSLLHCIQSDILNLEDCQNDEILDTSKHKFEIERSDRSLAIHACHSPMREVEVLHDKLLAMFDANPTLKPRDIIVMVADINNYSPAIQAVFGNAPGNRYIPFSISDRTAEQENPLLQAFLRLIVLPESRCSASEMLELLEVPAVMNKFGFDSSSFELVKRWIEESGIRWGLDEFTASQFELPQQQQNSWLFGIQRMLLGYAMPHDAGLFSGISAYDQVQGLSAEHAGQLASFIDQLIHYRSRLSLTQSITSWNDTLLSLVDDLFEVELDGELILKSIRDCLHRLQQQLADAGYQQPLTPAVLTHYLQDKLSGERVSQRFLAGQVNFCTLMPMRSIPFNVVCLLGMNDGAYPRNIPPEGFDLMNGRTVAGDRSRRDDDRYLFLEAIQSAQQTLYISYVGRSIQDNSEKVPSVLVSELIEYCQQGYCLQGDQDLPVDQSAHAIAQFLNHHHSLVPFSPSAFQGEQASYASEWLPAALREGQAGQAFQQTPLVEDEASEGEKAEMVLDLAELQRFWTLPVRYFFNRRLKVHFEAPMGVMDDDEPFILNNLDGYLLRDELLEQRLQVSTEQTDESALFSQFSAEQRAAGKLPISTFGDLELAHTREEVATLSDEIRPLLVSKQPDQELKLSLMIEGKKMQLQGWLKQRYGSGLVRYRSGKVRSQDRLTAWLDHLCLSAMGLEQRTHLVGTDAHLQYQALGSEQAKSYLQELVALYYQGLTQPIPYFPKTALTGIEAHIGRNGEWKSDEKTQSQADKKRQGCFNDGYLFSGEGANDYIRRVWPSWSEPLNEQLSQLASRVLQAAVLNSQESQDKEK
ncbi:MAG: exodeoxyribonuclease V subunit gamma [Aliivibrio sp.]|uniref:exodeoxyribonuclease V subunit gamma n=1 Tax=Aliivibrio sp. TaxID=1872443 RepID=UPI001A601CDF|nr:exodeoxyribonuclease V subunit gamma [Aliivibrio sp.]